MGRMKEMASSIDDDNRKILKALHETKTGVPNQDQLQKNWSQKMNYTKILQKKNSKAIIGKILQRR